MCLCGHLTMLSHPNSRPLILIALGFSKSFIEVQIFILEGKKIIFQYNKHTSNMYNCLWHVVYDPVKL